MRGHRRLVRDRACRTRNGSQGPPAARCGARLMAFSALLVVLPVRTISRAYGLPGGFCGGGIFIVQRHRKSWRGHGPRRVGDLPQSRGRPRCRRDEVCAGVGPLHATQLLGHGDCPPPKLRAKTLHAEREPAKIRTVIGQGLACGNKIFSDGASLNIIFAGIADQRAAASAACCASARLAPIPSAMSRPSRRTSQFHWPPPRGSTERS
jgi:hypothetical protein